MKKIVAIILIVLLVGVGAFAYWGLNYYDYKIEITATVQNTESGPQIIDGDAKAVAMNFFDRLGGFQTIEGDTKFHVWMTDSTNAWVAGYEDDLRLGIGERRNVMCNLYFDNDGTYVLHIETEGYHNDAWHVIDTYSLPVIAASGSIVIQE